MAIPKKICSRVPSCGFGLLALDFGGGVPIVVIQEPAEQCDFLNRPGIREGFRVRLDDLVAEPLMRALRVVVLHELVDGVSEGSLAEEDHIVQALAFDGLHETLGMAVYGIS